MASSLTRVLPRVGKHLDDVEQFLRVPGKSVGVLYHHQVYLSLPHSFKRFLGAGRSMKAPESVSVMFPLVFGER